ncbi:MAG: leucine-rich repeat domain-containing protein, partial [Ruminiclostridium sp.]|nr:leucine-rich repeat domain-containing protein [Ruminiclostridium sp.]
MKKFLIGIAMFFTVMMMCVVSAGAEIYGDYEYEVLDGGTVKITDYTGSDYNVEIPSEISGKAVTSIGDYAFSGCSSLVSIAIPDGVTNVGNYAFRWCTSLASITIPDSVTSIGYYAFGECSSLTSITIPDSVTSIGSSIGGFGLYGAFHNCSSL